MELQTEFVVINKEPAIVQQLLFTAMETDKPELGENSTNVGDGMSENDSDDDYKEGIKKNAAERTDNVIEGEVEPEDQVDDESEICIITLIPDYENVASDQGVPHAGSLPYQCNFSPDSFISKSTLAKPANMKHMGRNNKNQDVAYHCRICNKEFHSKNGLAFHEKNFHTEAHIFCPDCNKGFKLLSDLDRHMNVHSGNRPFKCDMCDKSFVSKSSLMQHKKLKHIGDIYKCEICDKTFNTEIDILRHGRVHTGVRPYKCEQCPKSYTCKSSLKTHQRVHEGKTLQCHFCEMTFYIESDRVRHETRHTGVKPYKCELCGNSYSCKSSLSVHFKNAHSTIANVNKSQKKEKKQEKEKKGKKEKQQGKEKKQKKEKKVKKYIKLESCESTEVNAIDDFKIKTEVDLFPSKKSNEKVEENIS